MAADVWRLYGFTVKTAIKTPAAASLERPPAFQRTREQLYEHYLIEKELANRLRVACREERRRLYPIVYEELYRRVPLHPQLQRKKSASETQSAVDQQFQFLQRFLAPGTTFLEVGAGDCALSSAVAQHVAKVYAVEVAAGVSGREGFPANLELILSDGFAIPVPEGSVKLAYSNQVMEHLHPEDASEQMQNIFRALAPGGRYACITPNHLNGPHDISRHFDSDASGFHLKEYTTTERSRLFREVGFSRVQAYVGIKRHYFPAPVFLLQAVEAVLSALPASWSRAIGRRMPVRLLLDIRLVGIK